MIETATDLRGELREQRIKNRLTEEKLKGRRLERSRRLLESTLDLITPYTNLLDQYRREPTSPGPASTWHRKRGRNYPIYQNEIELALYRAQARVLCATNSYAVGMQEGLSSFILGTGIQYRAVAQANTEPPEELLQECQRTVDEFLDREQWFGGELPGLEEELDQRSREDGEWFLAHFCDDAGLTSVRVVEPEQITAPPITPTSDEYDWLFGVKSHRHDAQKPLGYWVQWGDTPTDGEEMSADDIVHFRRNAKRGMKRGFTDFAFDTYDALSLGGLLRTNMADAAAQQAAIVGVRQHATSTKDQIEAFNMATEDATLPSRTGAGTESNRLYKRGQWEDIDKGQEYKPGPLATNSPIHIEVLQACLRGAAVRWNAPEWLVSGLHDTSSFASSLTAESPFTRRIQRAQRATCAVHRTTMLIVLRNRAEAGQIVTRGRAWTWDEIKRFVDVKAEPQSPQVRNRLEEAQTASLEIPMGVDSRQRYAQAQGREWAQVQKDNEDYIAETGGSGAQLPIPGDIQGKGYDKTDVRQLGDFDCGPAALAAVLHHHGIESTPADLITALGTTPKDGTSLERILAYVRGQGLEAATYEGLSIRSLQRITEWGWPCIALVQAPTAPESAITAGTAGHYVTIFAADENEVSYQDPLAGPQTLPADEFAKLWHYRESKGKIVRRVAIAVGPSNDT